jgi:hypothetical protein
MRLSKYRRWGFSSVCAHNFTVNGLSARLLELNSKRAIRSQQATGFRVSSWDRDGTSLERDSAGPKPVRGSGWLADNYCRTHPPVMRDKRDSPVCFRHSRANISPRTHRMRVRRIRQTQLRECSIIGSVLIDRCVRMIDARAILHATCVPCRGGGTGPASYLRHYASLVTSSAAGRAN